MDESHSTNKPALATLGQRYFHTVRYLKPQQVVARLWLALPRPAPKPLPTPDLRTPLQTPVEGRLRDRSMLSANDFLLLNERGSVRAAADWNDDSKSKLWLYNLHYFDDLSAPGAAERRGWHQQIIERWVADNPPTNGAGWEPYPISLRSVNWITWDLRSGGLSAAAVASLAAQLRWLRKRLERHLMGSHLLANAKALIFGGLYFEGEEAQEWLKTGLAIFGRELEEQILADGGHFELSPMYHLIVLEDVLDTLNILQTYGHPVPPAWATKARKQLAWAVAMQHPDGQIPFFNDSALGVAGSPADLLAYASRLGVLQSGSAEDSPTAGPALGLRSSTALLASGYTRLATGDAVLFFDAAAVGPDYLPGHAHADTLSVEFSLFGSRVLVNSGTSTYGDGPERLRQRGTASHNTVVIGAEDSSEVWGGFRVARRARISGFAFDAENNSARAAHDGYRRLPGRPVHARSVQVMQGMAEIEDLVESQPGSDLTTKVELVWHFSPTLQVGPVRQLGMQEGSAQEPGVLLLLRVPTGDGYREAEFSVTLSVTGEAVSGPAGELSVTLEPSNWHPEFGVSVANQRLVVRTRLRNSLTLTTRIKW